MTIMSQLEHDKRDDMYSPKVFEVCSGAMTLMNKTGRKKKLLRCDRYGTNGHVRDTLIHLRREEKQNIKQMSLDRQSRHLRI